MTSRTKDDVESAATRLEQLETELQRSHGEKKELEEQLVVVKVRAVETMQKVDSMECLIEYYEDQLRALDPKFEPVDIASVGQWMKPSRQDGDADSGTEQEQEQESVMSQEKPKAQQIAKGISKMLKKGGILRPSRKKGKHHDAQEQDEFQTTPRDVEETGRRFCRASATPSPQPSPSPRELRDRYSAATPAPGGRSGPSPRPSPQPNEHAGDAAAIAPPPVIRDRSHLAPPGAAAAAAIRGAISDTASPMPSEPDPPLCADGSAAVATVSPARPKKRWEMRRED